MTTAIKPTQHIHVHLEQTTTTTTMESRTREWQLEAKEVCFEHDLDELLLADLPIPIQVPDLNHFFQLGIGQLLVHLVNARYTNVNSLGRSRERPVWEAQ